MNKYIEKKLKEFDENFPMEVYQFDTHDGYGNNKREVARKDIKDWIKQFAKDLIKEREK